MATGRKGDAPSPNRKVKASPPDHDGTPDDELTRFVRLAEQLVRVPKEEIDAERKRAKKA